MGSLAFSFPPFSLSLVVILKLRVLAFLRDEGRGQGCLHGMRRIWVSRFLVAPTAGLADGPGG